MPIDILMPALSPTMEEGNLAKWHVKEGDSVSSGDVIAEIETDKATMEVESIDEGTVGKILVAEGTEGVKVNALIAVLLEEGEDASSISDAPAAAPKAASTPAAEAAPAAAAPAPTAASAAPAPAASGGARVFASPLARRIAKENGPDISTIAGTGPHNRVIKKDVENAIAGGAGSGVNEYLLAQGKPVSILNIGIPDQFVKHGTQEEMHHELGLDAEGIITKIAQFNS